MVPNVSIVGQEALTSMIYYSIYYQIFSHCANWRIERQRQIFVKCSWHQMLFRETFMERCPNCQSFTQCKRTPEKGKIGFIGINRINTNNSQANVAVNFSNLNAVCFVLHLRKGFIFIANKKIILFLLTWICKTILIFRSGAGHYIQCCSKNIVL